VIFGLILGDEGKTGSKIFFTEEYILSLVSSGNYMRKAIREMGTRFVSHENLLPQRGF